MGFLKKSWILLIAVTFLTCFMPPDISKAELNTTLSINSGNTILLNKGEEIIATEISGIPVEIKNLPDLGAPVNGMAAFQIRITWDKNVINVNSAYRAKAISDWEIYFPSTPDNINGFLTSAAGTTTYSSNDVVILFLGITAVGNAGDSTILSITVSKIGDKDGVLFPTTVINSIVRITGEKYITVTPSENTIAVNTTQQYNAQINYSDGKKEDITNKAVWSSNNEKVATINSTGEMNPGLATGISKGVATLTAEYDGVRGNVLLTVTPAVIQTVPVVENTDTTVTQDTPDNPVETDNSNQPAEEVSQEIPPDDTPVNEEISEPAVNEPTETEEENEVEPGSKLPVGWIIGGVAAFVAVLGVLGYTFLTRRRY